MEKIKQSIRDTVKSTVDSTARSLINTVISSIVSGTLASAVCMIPIIGILIQAVMLLVTTSYHLVMEGLDIPLARHKYSYYEQVLTSWNNLSVILGCGFALLLLMVTPAVILFYPILIISTTRLFVHLDIHGRTARRKPTVTLLGHEIGYAGFGHGNVLGTDAVQEGLQKLPSLLDDR